MGACAPCGCSEYDRKDRQLRAQLPRIEDITGIENLKELKLEKVSQMYLHEGEEDTSLNSELLCIMIDEHIQKLGMRNKQENQDNESYTFYSARKQIANGQWVTMNGMRFTFPN